MHPANLHVTHTFSGCGKSALSCHTVPMAQSTSVTGAPYVWCERSRHITLSHSNGVWKQGKKAWPLFNRLYFWFYSPKILITLKAAGFKTMPSIISLNFRKHAGRKRRLPNIFNLSGIFRNPCCELERGCFHSELDTGWMGPCVDTPSLLNLQPSPTCLWSSEGFSAHFLPHLKGGINFASHLALISGSVTRISSIVVGIWLETSPSRPGTLPSRRSVCHSTAVVCSWCKTPFEIWKHPAFLLCGQDKPSFLPLCWDPPCGTDARV